VPAPVQSGGPQMFIRAVKFRGPVSGGLSGPVKTRHPNLERHKYRLPLDDVRQEGGSDALSSARIELIGPDWQPTHTSAILRQPSP
jgi:hypothetical protein